jgi:alpha-1,3-rhamnosyl/mannosyltransferase
MRVAVDARALQGQLTGVGRYLEGLLGAWLDQFPRDEFVLLACRTIALPSTLGRRVETRGASLRMPGTAWLQTAAPITAVRERCDLFFAPLGIAPLAAPIPCVVTIHDLTPLLFPAWHRARNRLGFVPLLAASLRKAAAVIAVSEATRQDLTAAFPDVADRCTVIHNGVTPPLPSGPPDPAAADVEPYVLYLGTLEPRKNVPRLVEAMERLWDAHPGFPHLELAGDEGWGLAGFRERLRASRHAGRIHVRGWVDAATASSLLAGARVLAYPSLYEGFGLPALEALALGTPVVASSSSSLPEVVGDAGLLPDPEDVGTIAAALLRAESDEAWRSEARRRGPARAALFTWSVAARATRALFEKALAG